MPIIPIAHSTKDENSDPQTYCEHVCNVRKFANFYATEITPYAKNTIEWNSLRRSISVAGEWHDLGKLDPENQTALNRGRGSKLPQDHIDAGVAHVISKKHLDYQAAWLIRSHHAPGLPSAVVEGMRGDFHLRGKRQHIDDDEFHRELVERNNVQLNLLTALHKDNIASCTDPEPTPPQHGLAMRIALSCLVDADHTDTGRFDEMGSGEASIPDEADPRWSERLRALQSYIYQLQRAQNSGDPSRNQVRQELFEHCTSIDLEKLGSAIVTCEASVGLGKTTAVLAYLLRQAISLKLRRIIVVAPYTAILTQTARTLKRAIILPGENPNNIILEHHHRAEFSDPSLRASSVLWEAPIILTTAVQFFETLGANNPSKLRKLHRLPGSAILIDETHASLPIEIWPQCLEWLNLLCKNWGCSVALVSGSMVKFWQHEWGQASSSTAKKIPEISQQNLVDRSKLFESARVQPREIIKPLSSLELEQMIKIGVDRNRSQLIIFNTVHSAAGFANHIRCKLDNSSDFHLAKSSVLHLSTALTPCDREMILTEIERRMENKNQPPWVLVATSCVEAGVDLDFADGFREGCSVSSFIQTSGRINRHGKFKDSTLTSFKISNDPLFKVHPQFRISSQVLSELFPEIQTLQYSFSEISTAALQRELQIKAEMTPGEKLSDLEKNHDYPAVAENCKIIKTDTCTVLVDRELAQKLNKGIKIPYREILNNSVQIWSEKIDKLGFEIIHSSRGTTELYFASPACYDPQFLGIMKAQLQSSITIL